MTLKNAPKFPNEMLLEIKDLQPGDRIIGREHGDWNVPEDFDGHVVAEDTTYVKLHKSGESFRIKYFVGQGRYRVVRTPQACAVVASVDRWNSKCGRCGSNTYVGFASVEHETADCQ